MMAFDYAARVDLFVGRGSFSHRRPLEYKPFPCASAAIRYAMEELSPERLGGICLVADELRFDGDGIRKLYESEAYPLERQKISRRSVRPVAEADAVPVVPSAEVQQ